jgi:hypothetical protein
MRGFSTAQAANVSNSSHDPRPNHTVVIHSNSLRTAVITPPTRVDVVPELIEKNLRFAGRVSGCSAVHVAMLAIRTVQRTRANACWAVSAATTDLISKFICTCPPLLATSIWADGPLTRVPIATIVQTTKKRSADRIVAEVGLTSPAPSLAPFCRNAFLA